MHKSLVVAFLFGTIASMQLSVSEAQTRIPGWNRVAPPGGHQNDPQLVRAKGGPVVPIFEGWFPNPDGTFQLVLVISIPTQMRSSIFLLGPTTISSLQNSMACNQPIFYRNQMAGVAIIV